MKRVGDLERKYVLDVLDSQFRTSQGAVYMTRFESAFSDKFKSKFAISHVNGTATMHSALEASGIGPGDEVIVPPLTMSATSLAVLHANATPIFADIDIDTLLLHKAKKYMMFAGTDCSTVFHKRVKNINTLIDYNNNNNNNNIFY